MAGGAGNPGAEEDILRDHPLLLYASEDWGFDFELAWGAFKGVRGRGLAP